MSVYGLCRLIPALYAVGLAHWHRFKYEGYMHELACIWTATACSLLDSPISQLMDALVPLAVLSMAYTRTCKDAAEPRPVYVAGVGVACFATVLFAADVPFRYLVLFLLYLCAYTVGFVTQKPVVSWWLVASVFAVMASASLCVVAVGWEPETLQYQASVASATMCALLAFYPPDSQWAQSMAQYSPQIDRSISVVPEEVPQLHTISYATQAPLHPNLSFELELDEVGL